MRKMILQLGTVLALSLLAANVMAAVSPQEAGLLGTEWGQAGAELAGFFRRHRGYNVGGQQTQGQNGAQLQNHLAH